MGNTSTSSDEEYERITLLESLSQRNTSPEWPSVVARTYCKAVDTDRKMLLKALNNKSQLLWFGRTISGAKNIVQFLDLVAPYSNHHFFTAMEIKDESSSESEDSMDVDLECDESPALENNTEQHVVESELLKDSGESSSTTGTDRQIHMESEPIAIINNRKRPATDETSFDELRNERNEQKNRENIENYSSIKPVSDNNDNLIISKNISNLEISASPVGQSRVDLKSYVGKRNELKNDEKSVEDREITSKNAEKIEDINNNKINPTLQNFMQYVTPGPVKHKQTVNVEEILKKAGENQPQEKVKPREIKVRAQLFLGKLARPGYKRRVWERRVKSIFLTVGEEIELIEYIGIDSCARNLLNDFNEI